MIRIRNLHQLISLNEAQNALEAHGCKLLVANLSIVPHTLDTLFSRSPMKQLKSKIAMLRTPGQLAMVHKSVQYIQKLDGA